VGTIDTELLKRAHPVEMVIARYGVELRPSGSALIGRCPLHVDEGRPNLHVYPASRSWYCYRCSVGGDVISFIQRIEGVGFREAANRLQNELPSSRVQRLRLVSHARPRWPRNADWGPAELACLGAAVELYHNRLLSQPIAFAYAERRGLDRTTLEKHRIGYASGNELAEYLRRRHLPMGAGVRVGLLRRDGSETMAVRMVVPEIRDGQPIWLVGRTITDPTGDQPKYLGLPGTKPLLGWEAVAAERMVVVVEGPFDWLTLQRWHYPSVALVGTHVRPAAVKALARFERIYLALDGDEAGRAAAADLARTLGERAVEIVLPGVKDVGELALRPDGPAIFAASLEHSELAQAA